MFNNTANYDKLTYECQSQKIVLTVCWYDVVLCRTKDTFEVILVDKNKSLWYKN